MDDYEEAIATSRLENLSDDVSVDVVGSDDEELSSGDNDSLPGQGRRRSTSEVRPSSSDRSSEETMSSPPEIVCFRVKEGGYANVSAGCDSDICNCDQDRVQSILEEFCGAICTFAKCRRQMCPYTVQNYLCDTELFGVAFKWLELGNFTEDQGNGDNDDHDDFNGGGNDPPGRSMSSVRGTAHTVDDESDNLENLTSDDSFASAVDAIPPTANASDPAPKPKRNSVPQTFPIPNSSTSDLDNISPGSSLSPVSSAGTPCEDENLITVESQLRLRVPGSTATVNISDVVPTPSPSPSDAPGTRSKLVAVFINTDELCRSVETEDDDTGADTQITVNGAAQENITSAQEPMDLTSAETSTSQVSAVPQGEVEFNETVVNTRISDAEKVSNKNQTIRPEEGHAVTEPRSVLLTESSEGQTTTITSSNTTTPVSSGDPSNKKPSFADSSNSKISSVPRNETIANKRTADARKVSNANKNKTIPPQEDNVVTQARSVQLVESSKGQISAPSSSSTMTPITSEGTKNKPPSSDTPNSGISRVPREGREAIADIRADADTNGKSATNKNQTKRPAVGTAQLLEASKGSTSTAAESPTSTSTRMPLSSPRIRIAITPTILSSGKTSQEPPVPDVSSTTCGMKQVPISSPMEGSTTAANTPAARPADPGPVGTSLRKPSAVTNAATSTIQKQSIEHVASPSADLAVTSSQSGSERPRNSCAPTKAASSDKGTPPTKSANVSASTKSATVAASTKSANVAVSTKSANASVPTKPKDSVATKSAVIVPPKSANASVPTKSANASVPTKSANVAVPTKSNDSAPIPAKSATCGPPPTKSANASVPTKPATCGPPTKPSQDAAQNSSDLVTPAKSADVFVEPTMPVSTPRKETPPASTRQPQTPQSPTLSECSAASTVPLVIDESVNGNGVSTSESSNESMDVSSSNAEKGVSISKDHPPSTEGPLTGTALRKRPAPPPPPKIGSLSSQSSFQPPPKRPYVASEVTSSELETSQDCGSPTNPVPPPDVEESSSSAAFVDIEDDEPLKIASQRKSRRIESSSPSPTNSPVSTISIPKSTEGVYATKIRKVAKIFKSKPSSEDNFLTRAAKKKAVSQIKNCLESEVGDKIRSTCCSQGATPDSPASTCSACVGATKRSSRRRLNLDNPPPRSTYSSSEEDEVVETSAPKDARTQDAEQSSPVKASTTTEDKESIRETPEDEPETEVIDVSGDEPVPNSNEGSQSIPQPANQTTDTAKNSIAKSDQPSNSSASKNEADPQRPERKRSKPFNSALANAWKDYVKDGNESDTSLISDIPLKTRVAERLLNRKSSLPNPKTKTAENPVQAFSQASKESDDDEIEILEEIRPAKQIRASRRAPSDGLIEINLKSKRKVPFASSPQPIANTSSVNNNSGKEKDTGTTVVELEAEDELSRGPSTAVASTSSQQADTRKDVNQNQQSQKSDAQSKPSSQTSSAKRQNSSSGPQDASTSKSSDTGNKQVAGKQQQQQLQRPSGESSSQTNSRPNRSSSPTKATPNREPNNNNNNASDRRTQTPPRAAAVAASESMKRTTSPRPKKSNFDPRAEAPSVNPKPVLTPKPIPVIIPRSQRSRHFNQK